jgi:hypothetical protein
MKIKKYDIFGNPINDTPFSEELDPFLENLIKSEDLPNNQNGTDDIKKLVSDYYNDPNSIVEKESTRVLKEKRLKETADGRARRRVARAARKAGEVAAQADTIKVQNSDDYIEMLAKEADAMEKQRRIRQAENAKRASQIRVEKRRLAKEAAQELGEAALNKVVKKIPKSKLLLAGLTGGASLAAQAAEEGFNADNLNESENEQLRQMQLEGVRNKNIIKNPNMRDIYNQADEDMRKFGPADYDLESISDKPQFRKLRKIVR